MKSKYKCKYLGKIQIVSMFSVEGTMWHFSLRFKILSIIKIKLMEMLGHFTMRENSKM